MKTAARAGTQWMVDNFQEDGRLTYYYDPASDTQNDHEHPNRDWKVDPYYNLLRHSGGVVTMLLDEQLRRLPSESKADHAGEIVKPEATDLRRVIDRSCEFFCRQLIEYQTESGAEAAYALYNRKSKLGGSGIGLFSLAFHQRLDADTSYTPEARRLSNHLVNEINGDGEFCYYNVYLDQPVSREDNQRYFSFYYPGEAILGLSHFAQHVCDDVNEHWPRLYSDSATRRIPFTLRRTLNERLVGSPSS